MVVGLYCGVCVCSVNEILVLCTAALVLGFINTKI